MLRFVVLTLFYCSCFHSSAQFKFADSAKVKTFYAAEDFRDVLSKAEDIFLKKLNAFRKTKGLKLLKNNQALSYTALNHCIWLRHHNKFIHYQDEDDLFYSGGAPIDRYVFVESNTNLGRILENIAAFSYQLDNFSSFNHAEAIAQRFFEMWKNSPVHLKNMLSKTSEFSGVSFLYKDRRIYGTHVYGANRDW